MSDGGGLSANAMCAAVRTICQAVELPVSADLEGGYGDAAGAVAMAIDAGAVGCNLEDRRGDPAEHAERLAAARAAGEAAGVPVVINARTDVFLTRDAADVDDAIARGRLYLDAGADCVFAIGARDPGHLRAMGQAFGGRLSVLAGPGWPPLAELPALGVARVTFGPGLMGAAYGALASAAEALLALEAPPDGLAFRPPAPG